MWWTVTEVSHPSTKECTHNRMARTAAARRTDARHARLLHHATTCAQQHETERRRNVARSDGSMGLVSNASHQCKMAISFDERRRAPAVATASRSADCTPPPAATSVQRDLVSKSSGNTFHAVSRTHSMGVDACLLRTPSRRRARPAHRHLLRRAQPTHLSSGTCQVEHGPSGSVTAAHLTADKTT